MKTLLFSMLLAALAVVAQTTLDPTQSGAYPKFPFYLDHSCGGVSQSQYGEQVNENGTITAGFRFYTNCNGSGRGAKDTRYLSCWLVTFAADRYTVLAQDNVLTTHWKQGAPVQVCPAL